MAVRMLVLKIYADTKTRHSHATSLGRFVAAAGQFGEIFAFLDEFPEALRSDNAAQRRPAEDRKPTGHLDYPMMI